MLGGTYRTLESRWLRRSSGDDRGFTLIETLIVILILGILAAIVVFAVINSRSVSSKAACQANYKTLETAAEVFKAETGSYPTQFSDLTGTAMGLNQQTDGPWLKELPATYSPGPPASITGKASYGFALNQGTQSIQVATLAGNGAQASTAPSDGNANCVYA